MRIALTIHALDGGGAERVISQLATRWAEAGHDTHLITWSTADTDRYRLSPRVIRHGLDLLRPSQNIWQSLSSYLKRIRTLRNSLQRIGPDVIVSFCDQMNIYTLQAARKMATPVWIAERSDPAKQRLTGAWEWLRRRSYPRCAGCVVQTQPVADYLSQYIPAERIEIIPNAIEVHERQSVPPEALASESGGPKIVLSVGRLSHEKGVDVLLEAWRLFHTQSLGSELHDWELHIAGEGKLQQQLEEQSRDLPQVKFLGWLSEPQAAYASARMFVLPSRYEGFPNALLEAMHAGLACVATRSSAAIDTLAGSGQALRVVDIESPQQMSAAMIELARDRQLSAALGRAAKLVSEQYTWKQIGVRWDRILDR